jgi:Transposase DDE domain
MIKPKPLQAPVEGGLTVDDFAVDEQAGTVTCPAGHTVRLSRTRIATFAVACRDCPLRARCTTCKTGRKLVLHPRDDLLRAARADQAADRGLREDYMGHRPNVERAVAQVATFRGRRLKLCYRGVARNHAWLKRRTAALNLRNLTGRRLARRDGAWGAGQLTSAAHGVVARRAPCRPPRKATGPPETLHQSIISG